MTITWVGRDNNQPTKLYGASGAMAIYQRYLANQTPTPLVLTPPEDVVDMGVDYDGNFVCSGGMRTLPVWTDDPNTLCQQGEMMQQQQQRQAIRSISRLSRSSLRSNSRRKKRRATALPAGLRRCSAAINHGNSTGWRCAYPVYTVTTPLCAT